jgi:hypothetical protein
MGMMVKYGVSFPCPVCYESVNLLTDNLYDNFDYRPWEPNWRDHLIPLYWVLHPCKHRLKEFGVTEWGGIWWKLLYPNKI